MKAPSPRTRRRRLKSWKAAIGRRSQQPSPWPWLFACLTLYAAAGLVLGGLPSPYWVWIIAIASVLMQAVALAGPQRLARFRWWFANLLVVLACLGAGALAAALAIAMGFSGSEGLQDMRPQDLLWEIIQYALLAILLAALCAGVTAATGDRLMYTFQKRFQTGLVLSGVCILGLAVGGIIGAAIA